MANRGYFNRDGYVPDVFEDRRTYDRHERRSRDRDRALLMKLLRESKKLQKHVTYDEAGYPIPADD